MVTTAIEIWYGSNKIERGYDEEKNVVVNESYPFAYTLDLNAVNYAYPLLVIMKKCCDWSSGHYITKDKFKQIVHALNKDFHFQWKTKGFNFFNERIERFLMVMMICGYVSHVDMNRSYIKLELTKRGYAKAKRLESTCRKMTDEQIEFFTVRTGGKTALNNFYALKNFCTHGNIALKVIQGELQK